MSKLCIVFSRVRARHYIHGKRPVLGNKVNKTTVAVVKGGIRVVARPLVVRLVERNEYKRRQAAPVLRVTRKAFGGGRRVPMARRMPE